MAREQGGTRRTPVTVSDVKVFKVVDLLVDEDNFRLEPNADQPAAIKAMLRRQGKKLVALAEDIMGGLSQGEFVWVAPDPRPEFAGKFVVCEGNRRVTALKILNEPALADGSAYSKRFRELGVDFRKSRITQVRGVLYPSVESARTDVYRRHTNDQDGKGLEAWDPFAQDRANKAQGKRRNLSMVVLEHLKTTTIEALADQVGLSERTTNADRLLSTFSKLHAAKHGIKLRGTAPYLIDLGSNPERAAELLRRILVASAVSVDSIKSERMRSDLLEEIQAALPLDGDGNDDGGSSDDHHTPSDPHTPKDDDLPGEPAPGPAGEPESEPDFEDEQSDNEPGGDTPSPTGGRKPNRSPLDRPTLAPTDRESTLKVVGVRLTDLYRECRKINVQEQPNAAAMLLRVFLELSCEAFLTKLDVRVAGGKSDWSDYGINLDTKIRKVLDKLDHEKKAKDLVDAHHGLSDDEGQSHSIRSLHRAMHDRNQVLDPRQIKLAWQRWHPLLQRVHQTISAK